MQLLEIKHNGTALRFIDDRRRKSENKRKIRLSLQTLRHLKIKITIQK